MKKAISIILSVIISVSVVSPCYTVIAEEIGKKDALDVGSEIADMCEQYDDYSELSEDDDKTIDNRLIVKFDGDIDEYGAVDSVYGFGYAFLQYSDDKLAKSAKEKYEKAGYTVDYDSTITTCSTSINTGSNKSDEWAYEETDTASALDYYKLKVKSTINVAVIDSGINYNHELFKNRVVRTNADFSTEASNDEMDTFGHGTNVAGAIAKSTPSNVKLSCYKIHNSSGEATSAMVLAALEYIKQLSNKPDIINCSFVTRSGLCTVVDELVDMGVTVVAGAGNEGKEVYQQPAIFDSVITVAATNQYGNASTFSNYGTCVDISAPGEYVYTASIKSDTSYELASGTSLSTPLVSAAAAYVLMEHKSYTPQQVKQKLIDTATPFKKCDLYNGRYGAGIINYSNIIDGTRCKDVTSNYTSGAYHDNISVELKCANSLVDIYYTTDGTLPTAEHGTKYTAPIDVTDSTRIIAVAYARAGTPMHSKFTYLDYYILADDESEFIIKEEYNLQVIKAYLGNETDVVVPDVVNGVVPAEIGEQVFKNSDIESIVLPETVVTIGENAFSNTNLKSITASGIRSLCKQCFYGCNKLTDIDLSTVKYIGSKALSGCELLIASPDFSSVEWVDERGLADTNFDSIMLPNCTTVSNNAFENCLAKEIVLNKATKIENNTFNNCKNLETIYAPKTTSLGGLEGCTSIDTIFAPKITSLAFKIPHDATIYCSDSLKSITYSNDYTDYKYTIVSPDYTPGLAGTDSTKYTRINSDEFAKSKGGQIRTRDNGLRFGFEFDENTIGFDYSKYAKTIEYGFVYTFDSYAGKNDFQKNLSLRANKSSVYVKSADKRDENGTLSTYNAVFTGIPSSHFDDKISARAYVCVDGMYFYSPVTTRSFNDVATAVLSDDDVDQNTKNELNNLMNKEIA